MLYVFLSLDIFSCLFLMSKSIVFFLSYTHCDFPSILLQLPDPGIHMRLVAARSIHPVTRKWEKLFNYSILFLLLIQLCIVWKLLYSILCTSTFIKCKNGTTGLYNLTLLLILKTSGNQINRNHMGEKFHMNVVLIKKIKFWGFWFI